MAIQLEGIPDYYKRLGEVEQYIRAHIGEPLRREALAALAGFSVPHFQRLFRLYVGDSTASYIRRERMLRAGRKLRMGAVDITQVALAAGYDTHAAFSKAFKQHFGMSPSEFRRLDCWTATDILNKI